MCWSCDGEVNASTVQCPYCGAHLGTQQEGQVLSAHSSDTYASSPKMAFTSPFSQEVQQEREAGASQFSPVYKQADEQGTQSAYSGSNEEESAYMDEASQTSVKEMLAFTLLLTAMVLFLFSVVLFLFSKDGFLVLKWKASYWYFCMAFSLPLFYFGWKVLNQVDERRVEA